MDNGHLLVLEPGRAAQHYWRCIPASAAIVALVDCPINLAILFGLNAVVRPSNRWHSAISGAPSVASRI